MIKLLNFLPQIMQGLFLTLFILAGKQKSLVGVNAKIVYRNIGKFANGLVLGFDLGAIYNADSGYKFGAMLRDATTTVNFWTINQKELSAVVNGEEFNPAPKDKMEITMPKLNMGISKNFELNRDLEFLPEAGVNVDFAKNSTYFNRFCQYHAVSWCRIELSENDFCECRC